MGQPAITDPLQSFRLRTPPLVLQSSLSGIPVRLSEFSGGAGHGLTAQRAPEDMYLVQLRLLDCARCDYFVDGQHVPRKGKRAGMIEVHDLLTLPRADIQDPFHLMYFQVPRAAFASLACETAGQRNGELQVAPGAIVDDPVARELFLAIRPALNSPLGKNRLFVDHVLQALLLHIAARFQSGRQNQDTQPRLARWQELRLRELIDASLSDALTLEELAMQVKLSPRQLSRAFRGSFDVPPYRYLMQRRILKAQQLLCSSELSLLDIALATGFSSQSHFNRVFRALARLSPGEWRRQHRR
jgi:AraC family transcriptional regulator